MQRDFNYRTTLSSQNYLDVTPKFGICIWHMNLKNVTQILLISWNFVILAMHVIKYSTTPYIINHTIAIGGFQELDVRIGRSPLRRGLQSFYLKIVYHHKFRKVNFAVFNLKVASVVPRIIFFLVFKEWGSPMFDPPEPAGQCLNVIEFGLKIFSIGHSVTGFTTVPISNRRKGTQLPPLVAFSGR